MLFCGLTLYQKKNMTYEEYKKSLIEFKKQPLDVAFETVKNLLVMDANSLTHEYYEYLFDRQDWSSVSIEKCFEFAKKVNELLVWIKVATHDNFMDLPLSAQIEVAKNTSLSWYNVINNKEVLQMTNDELFEFAKEHDKEIVWTFLVEKLLKQINYVD